MHGYQWIQLGDSNRVEEQKTVLIGFNVLSHVSTPFETNSLVFFAFFKPICLSYFSHCCRRRMNEVHWDSSQSGMGYFSNVDWSCLNRISDFERASSWKVERWIISSKCEIQYASGSGSSGNAIFVIKSWFTTERNLPSMCIKAVECCRCCCSECWQRKRWRQRRRNAKK